MKSKRIVLAVLVLAFMSSCARENWTSLNITERQMPFPSGYYDHIVYLNGQVIGFSIDTHAPKEQQISFAFEGDEKATPFRPGSDPNCAGYLLFHAISILPDGRLGLLKECKVDRDITPFRTIYAYDWHSGELEQLVPDRLKLFGPKFYTWNPDMTLGVQETNVGYHGTIYWIAADGTSPMDIEIEDRGLTWNLKDYLDGKERTGLAVAPAWSPDGNTIAFFVSIYGIREEPVPKFNVNYDLFFMDPNTLEPGLELKNVADAGNIVWSPNNKLLLFSGCFGEKLTCGLWRYKIEDQSMSLIREGEFEDYIWVTNNKVVATMDIGLPYSSDNQVWEYTILEDASDPAQPR